MVLKFKQRGTGDVKKVLIYGADGSGKSTFAEAYCNENNLSAVCIDIDDTNYTNVPILELDLGSDVKAYRSIKRAIAELSSDDSFDTIIIDGVTSMLELFVSKAKGIKKYGDRAERFNDVLHDLLNSKKNLIFIGQIDMKAIHTEDFQSPKPVIKINSIVNEKYLCEINEKGEFTHKVLKFRTLEHTSKSSTVQKAKSPIPIEEEFSYDVEHEEPPKLINECIDALTARGMKITTETVKVCLEGRFKNEEEYQEAIDWLNNIGLGGA